MPGSASISVNRPGCSAWALRTRPHTAAPPGSGSESATARRVRITSRVSARRSSASHRCSSTRVRSTTASPRAASERWSKSPPDVPVPTGTAGATGTAEATGTTGATTIEGATAPDWSAVVASSSSSQSRSGSRRRGPQGVHSRVNSPRVELPTASMSCGSAGRTVTRPTSRTDAPAGSVADSRNAASGSRMEIVTRREVASPARSDTSCQLKGSAGGPSADRAGDRRG